MVLRSKARKMNQIDISYSPSIKNGFKLDFTSSWLVKPNPIKCSIVKSNFQIFL